MPKQLKTIGTGILQYTQDYDEKLPCGVQSGGGPNGTQNGQGWGGQIYTYVKAREFMSAHLIRGNINNSTANGTSYGYNMNFTPAFKGGPLSQLTNSPKSVMLFEIQARNVGAGNNSQPDVTQAFDGAAGVGGNTYFSPVSNGWWMRNSQNFSNQYNPSIQTGVLAGSVGNSDARVFCTDDDASKPSSGRHLEGSNFLLADGHVKWLKGAVVATGMPATSETGYQGQNYPGYYTSAAGTNGPITQGGTDIPAATFSPI